jgi:hypothetical protein
MRVLGVTMSTFATAPCRSLQLKQRILKGIDEMNAQPVRFHWKKFDFQFT